MQATGDHQVQNQKQISFKTKYDALAKTPKVGDFFTHNIGEGRGYGTHEKGARDQNVLDWLTENPRLESFNVRHNVR